VVEESQGLLLAKAVGSNGVAVVAYDPVVVDMPERHCVRNSPRTELKE
jgi:hypothetical protein